MDPNSLPPDGTPERPADQVPPDQAQPKPEQQAPPPGSYTPPPGYSMPQQGYPPQSFPPQQGYSPQGYPSQGGAPGGTPPGYPPQSYPPPGYQQGYPPQGAPPPGYPPPGYPPPGYPQYGPQDYAAPRRSGGMPVWGWILIVGAVFVIIICAGLFAFTAFLGQQVNNAFTRIGSGLGTSGLATIEVFGFYSSLESHEYDSAYNSLDSGLAAKYSVDDLRTKWEALEQAEGPITPGFPTSDNVTGDTASVSQTLSSSKGKTYTVTVKLQKASGGQLWKITDASPGLIPEP